MTETGIVQSVQGKKVVLEIDPSAGCGSCPGKAACQLDREEQKRSLQIITDFPVKVGDLVEIEVREGQAILSAFVVFIVPLLFLGIGYAVAAKKGQEIGALGAFVGLIVGLALVWILDRLLGGRNKFQPRIVRIVENDSSGEKGV